MLVVLAVGHEQAHVGQQGGRLEQLAGLVAEVVQRARGLVEQLEGQPGHVGRVVGLLVHHLGQADHAAPAQVVEVVERGAVACAGRRRAARPRAGRSPTRPSRRCRRSAIACSRMMAPARMMSARAASMPGSCAGAWPPCGRGQPAARPRLDLGVR